MNRTKLYYSNRIHRLEQKDPVVNVNIIKKLKRRLRLLENN